MKLLLPLLVAACFASCSTPSFIQANEPIRVSAVRQTDTSYIVEGYGMDSRGKRQYVYVETKEKYTVGDVLWTPAK